MRKRTIDQPTTINNEMPWHKRVIIGGVAASIALGLVGCGPSDKVGAEPAPEDTSRPPAATATQTPGSVETPSEAKPTPTKTAESTPVKKPEQTPNKEQTPRDWEKVNHLLPKFEDELWGNMTYTEKQLLSTKFWRILDPSIPEGSGSSIPEEVFSNWLKKSSISTEAAISDTSSPTSKSLKNAGYKLLELLTFKLESVDVDSLQYLKDMVGRGEAIPREAEISKISKTLVGKDNAGNDTMFVLSQFKPEDGTPAKTIGLILDKTSIPYDETVDRTVVKHPMQWRAYYGYTGDDVPDSAFN